MNTTTIQRANLRRPSQLPQALSSEDVTRLLNGEVSPPTSGELRAHLAVDYERAAYSWDGEQLIDPLFGPQHTSTQALPDPRVWVQRFAFGLVECLDGRRPPAQLSRHVDADVLARLQRRYRTSRRRGGSPGFTGVRRVRVCEPRDGVIEAAVVARVSGRPAPIALRLNGVDGRWIVTVIEML